MEGPGVVCERGKTARRAARPEGGLPSGPYPAVCTDWRRLQLGGLLDPAHGKGNAAALLVHLQHL